MSMNARKGYRPVVFSGLKARENFSCFVQAFTGLPLTKWSLVVEEGIVWNKTWYLRHFSNHSDSICLQLAPGSLVLLHSRDGDIILEIYDGVQDMREDAETGSYMWRRKASRNN